MTKREGELYFDFIERCSHNPDSVDVKMSDLRDNSNLSRNERLMTASEIMKSNAYIISNQYLIGVKQKEVVPGMLMTLFLESRPQLYNEEVVKKFSSHYVAAA